VSSGRPAKPNVTSIVRDITPTPQQSLDAEESVLGAMMISPTSIDSAAAILKPNDFYRQSHGVLFHTMVTMQLEGTAVDLVTLYDRLERDGLTDAVGGQPRVLELACIVPATANTPHWANIVKDKAVRRAVHTAGMEITALSEKGLGSTDELLAEAESALTKALLENNLTEAADITDNLDELVSEWRQAYLTKTPVTGTKTGFTVIDQALGGLWPGQLILLAARPSVGKSTLAQNIAENVADDGHRVLFFTLEMSSRELQTKGIARAGKIDSERLSQGMVTEDEAKKLKAAINAVKARQGKLLIHAGGAATIPVVTAEATRVARKQDLALIIVDYIQLMTGVGNTKTDEIGSLSRGLKLLAQRLQVPILACSQMNRAIIHRADKRPELSDLRDSGSLEQDADVVAFLHKDSDYDTAKQDDGSIEFLVAKNRRGRNGEYKLLFTGRYSSFLNPASLVSTARSKAAT
jgi:replicative DNA helicase